MTPYRELSLNNAWANATLYAALATLPAGGFTAPVPGFFPTLCRTLNHLHEADLYFLDALEMGSQGRNIFARDDVTDPETLGQAQSLADMRLAQFCSDLTPDALSDTREMERKDGRRTETVGNMLLQLFQHQIHHRGQAHVQLQAAGGTPPQLDEFFLSFNRAPSAAAYWS